MIYEIGDIVGISTKVDRDARELRVVMISFGYALDEVRLARRRFERGTYHIQELLIIRRHIGDVWASCDMKADIMKEKRGKKSVGLR